MTWRWLIFDKRRNAMMKSPLTQAEHKPLVFRRQVIDLLRVVRRERGIGVDTATAHTGLNVPRIEQSYPDLTLQSMRRLCRYYDISLSDFFTRLNTTNHSAHSPVNPLGSRPVQAM